jgi:hypothetical protein
MMRSRARRKISPMSIQDLISPRNRTAKGCSLYVVPFNRLPFLTNRNQMEVNLNPSPSQKSAAVKSDNDSLVAMAEPDGKQVSLESSDDDGPLMNRRRVRGVHMDEEDDNTALRQRGSRRDAARDHRREVDDHARNRPVTRQLVRTPAKNSSKRKKPSSPAYSAKPMKNDMKSKQGVIREIEGFWGRGFIKTYIPKCHRPLTKRGNDGRRSIYRRHEMDPMKWLPSVLKAILMIAKLTDNKEWLKRAMNDIVRYRIKHTGNRKPQLVTTDFDVIEDMLVKDWSVAYSFEIRYKHLLVNRKDQEEDDENIDRILQVNSEKDGDSDQDDETDDDEEEQDEKVAEYEDESDGHGGISSKYLRTSGYTKESRHSTPGPTRQQPKQSKLRKETQKRESQSPQEHTRQQFPGIHGYGAPMPGYGPPMDPWGRAMPGYSGPGTYNNGYGGYGIGPGSYHFYGPPTQGRGGRQDSRYPPNVTHGMPHYPPPHHTMTPAPSIPDSDLIFCGNNPKKRSCSSLSTANKRARTGYGQSPDLELQRYTPSGRFEVKQESPIDVDAYRSLTNDQDNGANDCDAQEDDADDDDIDDAAVADAEVAAMELELKLAKLKAARMREKLKKK